MDPDQEQSDLGPHCLPVCKNRFEKFSKIFSRRHKQMTFSDADFLGALRVNTVLCNKVSEKCCIKTKICRLYRKNDHQHSFISILLYTVVLKEKCLDYVEK